MTDAQYIMREANIFHADLSEVERAPLNERKQARDNFRTYANNHVAVVIERIRWLLNGSYGYGSQYAYKQLSKRMNRRAWLFVTIAALEWKCPNKYAREVWNGLDTDLQSAINRMIDDAIADDESEE